MIRGEPATPRDKFPLVVMRGRSWNDLQMTLASKPAQLRIFSNKILFIAIVRQQHLLPDVRQ